MLWLVKALSRSTGSGAVLTSVPPANPSQIRHQNIVETRFSHFLFFAPPLRASSTYDTALQVTTYDTAAAVLP